MKITKVKAYEVQVPLAKAYNVSYGTLTHGCAVIVEVYTDTQLVGIGEADPLPPFTSETAESVLKVLQDFKYIFIGRDPRHVNKICHDFDQALEGNMMAKGAIDMALWDIIGKDLNKPVYQLLGGSLRNSIPLLWPLSDQSPEQDLVDIKAKIALGYHTFMLKMGSSDDIHMEIERVRSLNQHFRVLTTAYDTKTKEGKKQASDDEVDDGNAKDYIYFNIDANQGWSEEQACEFVEGIKGYKVDFIEQPMHKSIDMTRLVASAAHPISADEALQSLDDAAKIAQQGQYGVFSLKISKNGGLTRCLQLQKMATTFGIKCLFNSMIEMGISQACQLQLALVSDNATAGGHCFMSTLRMKDDLTNFSTMITEGIVTSPSAPGLGVTVDMDKVAEYCVNEIEIGS